jgi:hypothetical protein
MVLIGNEDGGSRIWISDDTHLSIESWGFWNVATANTFEHEALATCSHARAIQGVNWNASGMKPQAEYGRAAIRNFMIRLAVIGFMKARNSGFRKALDSGGGAWRSGWLTKSASPDESRGRQSQVAWQPVFGFLDLAFAALRSLASLSR